MKLLSIDPSSTKTGYAVFDGNEVIDAGLLTGKSGTEYFYRVFKMMLELDDIFKDHKIDRTVIESPSGHVHGRLKGHARGQATYGFAVGAIWAHSRSHVQGTTLVDANRWTRGIPKKKRQAVIALKYPDYDADKDTGGDVSDAIGLGEWWLAEKVYQNVLRAKRSK